MRLRWRRKPDGTTEWVPIDQWIRENNASKPPIGPVVKIRALDYTVDKMYDKEMMRQSVETVKRYRHVGCPEQYGK